MTTLETARDREVEIEVATAMNAIHPGTYLQMPQFWPYDFAACFPEAARGRRNAIIEVKSSDYDFGSFGAYVVGQWKFERLRAIAQAHEDCFCILAVRWKDCIGTTVPAPGESFKVGPGGRDDRGFVRDKEPMVHIPFSRFKVIA
jgi:hypothetical protein